jgi:hypothetical protein
MAHPDALRAMPLLYLQTRKSIQSYALVDIDLLGRDHILCGLQNDIAKSALEIRDVRKTYVGKLNSPEHPQWLVRTLKPGHHLCELLEDCGTNRRMSDFSGSTEFPEVPRDILYGWFTASPMRRVRPRTVIGTRW